VPQIHMAHLGVARHQSQRKQRPEPQHDAEHCGADFAP
jgi:hypothetical protein